MKRSIFALLLAIVIFTVAQVAAATDATTLEPTAVSANRFIDPNGVNLLINPLPPFMVRPNQCLDPATPCLTLDWGAGQADPGDTIVAACGLYKPEETAVLDKNLTVSSDSQCAIFSASGKRVINIINGADVTLLNVQVNDGDAGNSNGGGIRVGGGSALQLDSVIVKNNRAVSGGGIYTQGVLTINNSEVRGNHADGEGGGIRVGGKGSLMLNNSKVFGNDAGTGGGIHTSGQSMVSGNSFVSFNESLGHGGGIRAVDGSTLTITDSTVNNNRTDIKTGQGGFLNVGGGLYISEASASIERSFFMKNNADRGGGIEVRSGELMIESSTFSDNVAAGAGGGLANLGHTTAHNSTFSGNEAGDGGAFYNWGISSILVLANVTAAFNEADSGGGLHNTSSGKVSLANSLFSKHPSGKDCVNIQGGLIAIRSVYLSEDGSCPNAIIGSASLLPLDENGGPTPTHMPLKSSHAVDAGDSGICAELGNVDQRMRSRVNVDGNGNPSDGNPCDLGAVERDALPVPPLPFTHQMPLVSAPR